MHRSTILSNFIHGVLFLTSAFSVYAMVVYLLTLPRNGEIKDTPIEVPVAAILNKGTSFEVLNLTHELLTFKSSSTETIPLYPLLFEKKDLQGSFGFKGKDQYWNYPSDTIIVSPVLRDFDDGPFCSACRVTGKTWVISKGIHHIERTIVVPENLQLIIEPGAKLIFSKGTGLLCKGQASVRGTKELPVHFTGTSWGGIVFLARRAVLNHLEYAHFENGLGLDVFGMRFTGMLNFIGGEVQLKNLSLSQSQAEDALNIKYAQGRLSNISVVNSESDAVDLDWSRVELSQIKTLNAKNDCLDFSNGTIRVESSALERCGDKAISNGEKNHLSLSTVSIENSLTGIVNKDFSILEQEGVSFKNVQVPFTETVKKNFFGMSNVEI